MQFRLSRQGSVETVPDELAACVARVHTITLGFCRGTISSYRRDFISSSSIPFSYRVLADAGLLSCETLAI